MCVCVRACVRAWSANEIYSDLVTSQLHCPLHIQNSVVDLVDFILSFTITESLL